MYQLHRHIHVISTSFPTRPASGFHRYTRQSSHYKLIHQRPQTHKYTHPYSPRKFRTRPAPHRRQTRSANQSTNDHRSPAPNHLHKSAHDACRPPTTLTPTRRQATPHPDAASARFRAPVIRQATSPYFDRSRPHDSTGRVPVIQPVTPLTSFFDETSAPVPQIFPRKSARGLIRDAVRVVDIAASSQTAELQTPPASSCGRVT